MSDSVRPHRRQPTRLPRPWDSPGKNTGVGCHFLLQCMKVKSEREVAESCPTLSNPMACSPPGSSVHGIFQARVLEWGAIAFSQEEDTPLLLVSSLILLGPENTLHAAPTLWNVCTYVMGWRLVYFGKNVSCVFCCHRAECDSRDTRLEHFD